MSDLRDSFWIGVALFWLYGVGLLLSVVFFRSDLGEAAAGLAVAVSVNGLWPIVERRIPDPFFYVGLVWILVNLSWVIFHLTT